MKQIRAPRAMCALVLLVLCGAPLGAQAGEEIMVDGVLHVRNPPRPPEGVERWALEELWRVGDDGDELLLGLPTRVLTDAQGQVHILDAQLNVVHVFSPEGKLLRSLFREGEGPGEIQNPSDMVLFSDGSVGVLQEFPGKVIRVDHRGDPLPSIHPGGSPESGGWHLLMIGRARGEHLVMSGGTRRVGDDGQRVARDFLASFNLDGTERACFAELISGPRSGPPREREMLPVHVAAWDIAPDGRVIVAAEWDRYELNVYRPDGRLDRVLEREFEPWRRTEADRERMLSLFGVEPGQEPPISLEDHAPCISILQGGVQVSEAGEIYVLSARGNRNLPDGVLAMFDVFDAVGHFRRQVEVACEGDAGNDRLIIQPGGRRLIRVRRFVDALVTSLGPGGLPEGDGEDLPPAVICYRIRS